MLRKGHTHNTQSAMGYLPCTNVQQKLLKQKATSRRVQEALTSQTSSPRMGMPLQSVSACACRPSRHSVPFGIQRCRQRETKGEQPGLLPPPGSPAGSVCKGIRWRKEGQHSMCTDPDALKLVLRWCMHYVETHPR